MTKTHFRYFPNRPKKLTAAFVKKEYEKLLERLGEAENSTEPNLWIKLFKDWDALSAYINSEASRVYYAYSKDMSDRQLEARDKYFSQKVSPVVAKPDYILSKAFLASRHRSSIAKKFGEQLIPSFQTAIIPMDPVNTDLRVRLSLLSNNYEKMTAKATVTVRGETVNLYKAASYLHSEDEGLRKESYVARGDWLIKNRSKLAKIYDDMVKYRSQMAKNVKLDNYVDFAYQSRGRQGYGPKEVEKFRKLILKHIVPMHADLMRQQARLLGKSTVKPWDIVFRPQYTVPNGTVPVRSQLSKTQKIFDKISPRLGKHFKYMRQHGLIDLPTRHNKRGGAFCIDFSDEGKVAILCNSTGDPDDIRVLTHEMGHAFQGWESQKIELADLQWGTAELAEIYSMSMEFLSLPFVDVFFDLENSRKFTEYKWLDSLYTVCYVCVVDEFQHWVYYNPKATPKQRDQTWMDIYQKYLPSVDFSGVERFQPSRWYTQSHIFSSPFYYIDYALAELCAMQMGMLSAQDYDKTVETYLKLCQIGGTKSFLEAVEFGGLESPFNEQLIKKVANHAKSVLI